MQDADRKGGNDGAREARRRVEGLHGPAEEWQRVAVICASNHSQQTSASNTKYTSGL